MGLICGVLEPGRRAECRGEEAERQQQVEEVSVAFNLGNTGDAQATGLIANNVVHVFTAHVCVPGHIYSALARPASKLMMGRGCSFRKTLD